MSLLDRKALLNYKSQLKVVEVKVSDDDIIRIKEMSVEVKEKFDAAVTDKNGKANFKDMNAKLLVLSIVDEDGELMFELKDAPKMRDLPFSLVQKLVEEVIKLNDLSEDSVEELAKN